jgi:isochorismate synthase
VSPGEHLSAALREGGPRVVVMPAPILDPLAVLRGARKCDAWWLERPASAEGVDETLLGLGVALDGDPGPGLTSLLVRARGLPRVVHAGCEASLVERLPLTFFGRAFAAGAQSEEPWTDHGEGCAVLARWTYLREGGHAVLAFATLEEAWSGGASLARAEMDTILGAVRGPRRDAPRARLESTSPAAFHDRVEAARAAIARGELTKVVCSRRATVTTETDLVAEDVIERLPPSAALRFFVRRGTSTLLGATPERLFQKTGTKVWTEALAGTRAGGPSRSEEALLASTKDLSEHAPVVEAIVTRLTRLGADVRADATPRLKHAANVVHLRTAIEARVPETTSALELLDALHPTPAVGGTPREAAEAFIRTHEPPRGWYSGPLGWIDARGDADVHVMLRCAVVRGARAWVFAGGGIVASSDPRSEHAETELKMAPMLRALGVEPIEESKAEARTTHEPAREALGAESGA